MKIAPVFAAICLASAGAMASTASITVIDKEGKPVQDAVVVVTPSAKGTPRTPLPMTMTVDQEKMRFIPAVALVPVGAKITMVNKDPWEHHVRGSAAGLAQFSSTGSGFELRLDGFVAGKPPKSAEVTMDKAGAVLLRCHIHGSLKGYVYVSDSPWAQRTTPQGQAVFDDLPDGAAQIRVWHSDQLLDLPVQTLQVNSASPSRLTVQLQVVPRRRRI